MQRRSFVAGLAAASLLPAVPSFAQAEPLPSWNDGPVKQAILDFLPRATSVGGSDFVPVPERLATFDNDGTLWTEQPSYFHVIFALDRAKAMVAQYPEWRTVEPFRSCWPTTGSRSPQWARRVCSRSWRPRTAVLPLRNSGRRSSTGSPPPVTRVSSDPTPTSSISRCSS